MINIKKLIKGLNILNEVTYNDKIMINNVSYHSSRVKNNDLFVCIKGYKSDGHKYLKDAMNNGAIIAVVEEYQDDCNIIQLLVSDSRIALALISANYYSNPSKYMKMIGITATNGKTTTSFMIDFILKNYKYITGLIGTVSINIDDEEIPSQLTTPESLELQYYLQKMKSKNVSHVTMEVSSSAIELNRIAGIDFDIVSFSNISREHIDLHGSYENYIDIKSSLIKNANNNSWAILNMDCLESALLINQTKANVLTFGINNIDSMVLCKNIDLSTGRGNFIVEIRQPFIVDGYYYEKKEFEINLNVPGYHSINNAMVAILTALLCKVPIDIIQDSLNNFIGVERRFEFIYDNNFIIIDDHFANSGNIDVTMKTLEYMNYNSLHLLYAIRGSRGPIVNKENALAIVKWAKKLNLNEIIATKSYNHTTEKDKVTNEEELIFKNIIVNSGINLIIYEELDEAISYILNYKVKDKDVVLLAGCQGMDCGAEIALKKIREIDKLISDEDLYRPLLNRICGINN